MKNAFKNVLVGSVLAVSIFCLLVVSHILLDRVFGFNRSLEEALKGPYFELALGGAIAGLVASRLKLQWLPAPSSQQSRIFRIATAAMRVSLLGAIYGTVCGATTGIVFNFFMLLDPHSTVTSSREIVYDFVAAGLGFALLSALIAGGLGALWGAVNSRSIIQSLQH